jgi:hypothetical protein
VASESLGDRRLVRDEGAVESGGETNLGIVAVYESPGTLVVVVVGVVVDIKER